MSNPGSAYELNRTSADAVYEGYETTNEDSSEAYLDIHTAGGDSTVVTAANILNNGGNHQNYSDATGAIHETHLALLYLLSHPEEFEKAVQQGYSATTLAQWNSEYGDNESLFTEAESVSQSPQRRDTGSGNNATPLPYAVFCDDAEVVLPQAHTASQLFGVETVLGMELEAAAGVPALSQLFLRWLALMPGGDHLNLIDPPGLTVMKIAGGRYRVTAAHACVWTWMNEFASLQQTTNDDDGNTNRSSKVTATKTSSNHHILHVGDLVSMTIIDVFETDNQGKLLSYCPTFDNRQITKTDRTAHALRKQTAQVRSALKVAQNSKLAIAIGGHVSKLASTVKQTVGDAVHNYNKDKKATAAAVPATTTKAEPPQRNQGAPSQNPVMSSAGTSMYLGDDDMERHEV